MKYRAQPVEVEAHRILGVEFLANGAVECKLDNGSLATATVAMMARYTPKPGDYWVRQADGYEYLNPKDVFERKYSLVKDAKPAPCDFTRATMVTPEVEKAVEDAFEYHPWSPEQVAAGVRVRNVLADAVLQIIQDVPPGPDRTVAIRKIREARMDANSAITHGGKY